jgi:hypothetical protein
VGPKKQAQVQDKVAQHNALVVAQLAAACVTRGQRLRLIPDAWLSQHP